MHQGEAVSSGKILNYHLRGITSIMLADLFFSLRTNLSYPGWSRIKLNRIRIRMKSRPILGKSQPYFHIYAFWPEAFQELHLCTLVYKKINISACRYSTPPTVPYDRPVSGKKVMKQWLGDTNCISSKNRVGPIRVLGSNPIAVNDAHHSQRQGPDGPSRLYWGFTVQFVVYCTQLP